MFVAIGRSLNSKLLRSPNSIKMDWRRHPRHKPWHNNANNSQAAPVTGPMSGRSSGPTSIGWSFSPPSIPTSIYRKTCLIIPTTAPQAMASQSFRRKGIRLGDSERLAAEWPAVRSFPMEGTDRRASEHRVIPRLAAGGHRLRRSGCSLRQRRVSDDKRNKTSDISWRDGK